MGNEENKRRVGNNRFAFIYLTNIVQIVLLILLLIKS